MVVSAAWGRRAGLGVLLLAAGFALTYRQAPETLSPAPQAGPVVLREGQHIVVAVVVDPACGACGREDFRSSIPQILDEVRRHGERTGYASTVALGISLGGDVRAGAAYLGALGKFDQIAVGGGYGAEAVLGLAARGITYPVEIPQVVVFRRRFTAGHNPLAGGSVPSANDYRLLLIKRGWDAVRNWVEGGLLIPEPD